MRILQQPVKARKGQVIKVHFDKPTKVKLLKHGDFEKYKKGKTHNYRGGHFDDSPAIFTVPADGLWHAVIEKGTFNNPLDVSGHVELADGDGAVISSVPKPDPNAIAAAEAEPEVADEAGETPVAETDEDGEEERHDNAVEAETDEAEAGDEEEEEEETPAEN